MSPRRFAPLGLAILAASALQTVSAVQAQQPRQQPQQQQQPNMPWGSQNPVPQPTQDVTFPLGQSWSLATINGRPVGGERPSMTLDDQLRIKGFAGCNTYSATAYPLREKGFVVGLWP